MAFWPWKKKKEVPPVNTEGLSDEDRIVNYFASGGEIMDLSNKDRLPNDGLPPDLELLQPYNQAHTGMKEGLANLAKGERR